MNRKIAKAALVNQFLQAFTGWAQQQPDILALALVGSYARGAATDDSDVDLVIISSQPRQYLADLSWTAAFGEPERHAIEDYGKLTSVRVWYGGGLEVEYGFTGEEWAEPPLDEGTRRVISDGMVVLYEARNLLSRHQPEGSSGTSVAPAP